MTSEKKRGQRVNQASSSMSQSPKDEPWNVPTGEVVRKHFPDLNFMAVATPYEHRVEFKIYETFKGEGDEVLFHEAGSHFHPNPMSDLAKAEIYFEGSVKWDGCSNWLLGESDGNYRHFCRRVELENIGKILAACHAMAEELCPNADFGGE